VIISLGEPVELEIPGDESEPVRLDRYETAVIPAAAGEVRAAASDGEYRLIGATAGGVSVFDSN
jgi:uncharacterized protein YjlB